MFDDFEGFSKISKLIHETEGEHKDNESKDNEHHGSKDDEDNRNIDKD